MTTSELLQKYNELTQDANRERALWNLLKANEKSIQCLIEDDSSGFWFHKSFRQIDVTGNSYIDMAIWLLLQDAPIFWKIINDETKES